MAGRTVTKRDAPASQGILAEASIHRLTLLLPTWQSAPTLRAAVNAALPQLLPGDTLLILDDGSTDHPADAVADLLIAGDPAVQLVHLPHQGVAATRNHGLSLVRTPLVLFTDADATLTPGAVARARGAMSAPDAPDAVVGVYTADCGATDVVSRYKNLWIRWTYLAAGREIDWLFGCLTISRPEALLAHGGFDASLSRDLGGSDVDLGRRMRAAGARIRLDPGLEVRHHRSFTLISLLRNDLLRAFGYARAMRRRGDQAPRRRLANIPTAHAVGGGLVSAGLAAALLAPLAPWTGLDTSTLAVAAAFAHTGLHARLYRFLLREGGVGVTLAAPALLALTQLAATIGAAAALLRPAPGPV